LKKNRAVDAIRRMVADFHLQIKITRLGAAESGACLAARGHILTEWLKLLGRQHQRVYHYAFVGTGVRDSGPPWSLDRYALDSDVLRETRIG